MSKKQRRNISQGPRSTQGTMPSRPADTEPINASAPVTSSSSTLNRGSSTRRFTGVTEFNPDYSHVVSDVKRIGIIAASYLVILVILSFILNR